MTKPGTQRDSHAELLVITRIAHGLHLDLSETGHISQHRARHPGKDDAGHHIDVAQPSPDVANQVVCKPKNPIRDPSTVHQFPGEHEKRDGQHGKACHGEGQLMGQRGQRKVAEQDIGQRG